MRDAVSPRRPHPSHRYRVVARRRRKTPEVLWLTADRGYATDLAAELGARLGDDVVWVESWTPGPRHGRWERVAQLLNSHVTSVANGAVGGLPQSGDVVQAVLLGTKTRRGKWRVGLSTTRLVGPITNSEAVPDASRPGDQVIVRVGAVNRDGSHLQLHWVAMAK